MSSKPKTPEGQPIANAAGLPIPSGADMTQENLDHLWMTTGPVGHIDTVTENINRQAVLDSSKRKPPTYLQLLGRLSKTMQEIEPRRRATAIQTLREEFDPKCPGTVFIDSHEEDKA